MKRREMIALGMLGLIGCATTKVAQAPQPSATPGPKCIVCGEPQDVWRWYGDEGPFCQKHLEERMAKDKPKSGVKACRFNNIMPKNHEVWHWVSWA